MAYTEQDMQKQMEQFAALRDEFSRLEAQEKALRRQAGLPEEGGERWICPNFPQKSAGMLRKPWRKPDAPGKPVPPRAVRPEPLPAPCPARAAGAWCGCNLV